MKRNICLTKITGIIILILLCLLSPLFSQEEKPLNEYLNKTYKYQEPQGNYLVGGGMEFFTIEPKTWGETFDDIKQSISSYWDDYPSSDKKQLYKKFDLRVFGSGHSFCIGGAGVEKGILKICTQWEQNEENAMLFIPNEKINGNWDMLAFSPQTNNAKRILNYFHKIKDPDKKIQYYFDKAYIYYQDQNGVKPENKNYKPAEYIALASSIINNNPDNYYLRTLYFDALIRNKDFGTLEKDLDKLKSFYTSTDDIFLQSIYNRCRRAIFADKLSRSGKNAWYIINNWGDNKTPWAQKIILLKSLFNTKECVQNYSWLIHPDNINWAILKDGARHSLIESYCHMIIGNRDEALDIMFGNYIVGNNISYCDNSVNAFIGSEIKNLCLSGIEIYLKNCCETKEEITSCTARINSLYEMETNLDKSKDEIDKYDYFPVMVAENKWAAIKPTIAKIETMRAAAASKQFYLEKKLFPKSDEPLKKYFKDNYPQDPYSNGPLRYISEANRFTLYSVGPDNIDDKAALYYDPTNGAISLGDIITVIPLKREYPFSKGGLKANSKAEVEKIFPNGLPPDPYIADVYSRQTFLPAAITSTTLQISDTRPVKIYSPGPDFNSGIPGCALQKDEKYNPVISYDPTNGVGSPGDVFWEIPERK